MLAALQRAVPASPLPAAASPRRRVVQLPVGALTRTLTLTLTLTRALTLTLTLTLTLPLTRRTHAAARRVQPAGGELCGRRLLPGGA